MTEGTNFISVFHAQKERYRSLLESNICCKSVMDNIAREQALSEWRSSASSDLLQLSASYSWQDTSFTSIRKVFLNACQKVLGTLDSLLAEFETSASSFGLVLLMKLTAFTSLGAYSLHVKALKLIVAYQDEMSAHMSLHFTRATAITERQRFPTAVLEQLQVSFSISEYSDVGEISRLSKATGLSLKQIRMWFVNRRRRDKRRAPHDNCSRKGGDNTAVSSPIKMTVQSPLATKFISSHFNTTADSFGDSKHADIEFYRVLLNSSTRNNWDDYADFFKV